MNGITVVFRAGAAGQSAGRHRTAVAHGAEHVGQGLPADAVDGPGPSGLAQRPRLGVRVFGQPADDVGGTQRLQAVGNPVCLGFPVDATTS